MKAPTRRLFPALAAGVALTVAAPALLHKFIVPPAAAETSMAALQAAGVPSLAPLIEKVTPAVVNVSVKLKSQGELTKGNLDQIPKEFRRFFEAPEDGDHDQPRRKSPGQSATGSGVIIDAKNGYIMTNFHVIDHADEITVTLKDRREFTAKLVGGDEGTDVALLKIDADNLTAIPIGDSASMKVGDFVVAVGNPFGLTQTVTSGIVSALGRSGLAIEGFEDFIQTDASINPGNSGGALVNMKGELIGINTAIIGPSGGSVGIGFAIPTSMAKAVEAQLVQFGEVRRGRIGVQIQDMTPELAKSLGVENQIAGAVIERVDHDSPAERGGVKAGDVVVEIDGKPLNNASDLRNRVGLLPVGSTVRLSVLDRKSTRLNSSHTDISRMPSSA